MQVNIQNNEYTLIFDEAKGTLMVNHNGGHWANYTDNKLVYSLMAKIVELESELASSADSIYDVCGHLLHED